MGKLKAANKAIDKLNEQLARRFSGVDFSLSESDAGITLNKLVVPQDQRGQGVGSDFMAEVTRYADEQGKPIALTADGDFGGSKAGQRRFYERQGFVPNKGRNKDFTFTENMIRPSSALGAAGVGLGLMGQSEDADAGVITKGGKRIIEAFHGSPHKFDRFSMDAIGTGEGAQAYGHGLYFADSEDVARGYRDTLSEGPRRDALANRLTLPDEYKYENELFVNQLDQNKGDIGETLSDLRRYANSFKSDGDYQTFNRLDEFAKRIESKYPSGGKLELEDNYGALYRAHIDVDPDTLLDWDKPLSEQSEAVQGAITNAYLKHLGAVDDSEEGQMLAELYANGRPHDLLNLFENSKGSQSYNTLAGEVGGGPVASSLLREQGIPGIRYADGMSRGAGSGTHNYVMFDDKPISIVERGNASPEILALTTAAGGFLAARQEKSSQWDSLRADLLGAVSGAAEFGLEALEIPWKGILGATRTAGGLASGESFNDAMFAGANQVRQPVEQTADQLGGAAVDYTGSPALGTAVNVGVNIGGPI